MDDLVLQSVLRIAENLPFLAFTLWLWSQERNARMLAEQRERETLLKLIDFDKEEY